MQARRSLLPAVPGCAGRDGPGGAAAARHGPGHRRPPRAARRRADALGNPRPRPRDGRDGLRTEQGQAVSSGVQREALFHGAGSEPTGRRPSVHDDPGDRRQGRRGRRPARRSPACRRRRPEPVLAGAPVSKARRIPPGPPPAHARPRRRRPGPRHPQDFRRRDRRRLALCLAALHAGLVARRHPAGIRQRRGRPRLQRQSHRRAGAPGRNGRPGPRARPPAAGLLRAGEPHADDGGQACGPQPDGAPGGPPRRGGAGRPDRVAFPRPDTPARRQRSRALCGPGAQEGAGGGRRRDRWPRKVAAPAARPPAQPALGARAGGRRPERRRSPNCSPSRCRRRFGS